MKIRDDKGSMLLEYVLILSIATGGLLFFVKNFYSTVEGFRSNIDERDAFGQRVVANYQRILGGISLPVP